MTTASTQPPAPEAIETLDDAQIDQLLDSHAAEPVLLYFTTPWCGPCRVFGPRLNAYVAEHPDLLRVVRVDGDEASATVARFRVQAFPTLTLVLGQEQLWLRAGTLEENELEEFLPRLAAAAREVAAVPSAADTRPEDEPACTEPRSTTIPYTDDPRMTVWHGRTQVHPGQTVELAADDGLTVALTSDPRQTPSCDLSALARFDAGVIDAVNIRCSHLTAGHIRQLADLERLAALDLHSSRPLSEDVVAALTALRDLRLVYLDAPGTDLAKVRRMLPSVMVNFDWTSPELSAHVPSPTRNDGPEVTRLPPTRLAEADTGTWIVLADRLARPAREPVRKALAVVSGVNAAQAVDADDPEIVRCYGLPEHSELLLLRDGEVLARRDGTQPHQVDELVQLVDALTDTAGPANRARPDQRSDQRSDHHAALDLPEDTKAYLVPLGGDQPDWVVQRRVDPDVLVPDGWKLLITTETSQFDALPAADTDALQLRLAEETPSLAALADWPRLAELAVIVSAWSERALADLAQLGNLRRLVVMGRIDDSDVAELRRRLPHTVVNNNWTHPDLAADTTERAS